MTSSQPTLLAFANGVPFWAFRRWAPTVRPAATRPIRRYRGRHRRIFGDVLEGGFMRTASLTAGWRQRGPNRFYRRSSEPRVSNLVIQQRMHPPPGAECCRTRADLVTRTR